MRVSACYIVRDEAANLARSIASVKTAVDEIIVVDTGSKDATVQVAQSAGAKTFFYAWQDDFAAARNFALTKQQGDWIVFLDADEYFSPATAGNLRAVIENHAGEEGILVQKLNLDPDTGENLVAFFELRIFHFLPGMRYERRIHEQLHRNGQPLEHLTVIAPKTLQIIHTGYAQRLSREKAERNLRLLLAELKETDAPQELYTYLAEVYDGLGDRQQAMQYARLDIAGGRQAATYASRSYRILLARLAENPQDFAERQRVAAQAVRDFPELPEFHAEYAESLAADFFYVSAIAEMQQASAAFSHYTGIEPMLFTAEDRAAGEGRIALWRRIVAREKEMRISACIIAKNEEREISRWLENVRGFANAIVFVDTGSTDRTREIVAAAGIAPISFTWTDDFSQARNFALEKAQGDWIVFIDADEYFNRPAAVRFMLAEMDCCQPQADAVMVTTVNLDADQQNRELGRCLVSRIFRRRPDLRYAGRVHENIRRAGGKLVLATDPGRLLLYHTGYSSGRIREKLRRDLALLQADIAAHGEGPQHYHYLADCYFGVKDYEKALHYAQLAIDSPVQTIGVDSDMYHEAIESMRQLKQPDAAMLAVAERAIKRFPQLPDFYAEKGMILCGLQRLAEARTALEKAVGLAEAPLQTQESTYFANAADIVYCRLGQLYAQAGEAALAREAFAKALRQNRYNREALAGWVAAGSFESPAALAAALAEFFPADQQDTAYLAQWARRAGQVEVYLLYAARLRQEFGHADPLEQLYVLVQQQKPAEVYAQVMQQAPFYLQALFVSLLQLTDAADDAAIRQGEQGLTMLPPGLVRVVQRYGGGEEVLAAADFDSYSSMLGAVLANASPDQLLRYAGLAADFAPEQIYNVAGRFYAAEEWAAAMGLYQQIAADSPLVTAEFWQRAGICLYYMGESEGAAECLQRAQAAGDDSLETAAYLKWSGAAGHA